jgi:pilus assembly protein CpaF
MGLRDRLYSSRKPPEDPQGVPKNDPAPMEKTFTRSNAYQKIKMNMHQQLIEHIDTSQLLSMDSPTTRQQIRQLLAQLLEQDNPPLNDEERRQMVEDLEYETFGLGPIEPLLQDPSIDDILVNRYDEVYIERSGRLERTQVIFRDNQHLLQVIERMVSRVGRRIDESSPMVDARLPDGSRVNAIIPPLAIDGPSLSIRRSKQIPFTIEKLIANGSINTKIAKLLEAAVRGRCNVLISGGTGSGKTTLLNAMIRFIGKEERIISIEDTAEMRLEGLHVVRLETRPPNIEGAGEVTQRDLIKNALRMRPDRILVGEVRGGEAYDMLQAMNTGHKGSLCTIHANSPRDALSRLETMILMAGLNLTSDAMRRQISSAVDFVIQLNRFPDGVRRLVSVSEIVGMEGDIIKMQDIARFEHTQGSYNKQTLGNFVLTGMVPECIEDLRRGDMDLPSSFFTPDRNPGSLPSP